MLCGETHAKKMVRRLATLLDDQIVSAKKNQLQRVEALMGETSDLAQEVAKVGAFEYPACRAWQEDIAERYRRLELILASARGIAIDDLKQTKTKMKMLAV